MDVIICADRDQMGQQAGRRVAQILRGRPDPVLGLATGSSPMGLYAELERLVSAGELDVSTLTCFALDEYLGIDPSDPNSYADTLRQAVTIPLGLRPQQVNVPRGVGEDIEGGCRDYEQAIADAGGIDVQILGIGSNGHLGFNEPGSSFASRTRVQTLSARTRNDNARFFASEQVPTHCVTQGLGTIMEARHLVLVAFGEGKAEAVAAAVEGPVASMCPASIMQFHPQAVVVIDEAAASRLRMVDYYRDQMAIKQDWR